MGSKYHDFIESADAIATMQDDSSIIREKIAVISDLGKVVIETSKHLLTEGAKISEDKHRTDEIVLPSEISSFSNGTMNVYYNYYFLSSSDPIRVVRQHIVGLLISLRLLWCI